MPFLQGVRVPALSFRYDEKPSSEFLPGWRWKTQTEEAPDGKRVESAATDKETGLRVTVRARYFADFPGALDWVVELENAGVADTPIIEDLLPLDLALPIPPDERVQLHHAKGSSCRMDDFLPQAEELRPRCEKTLAPVGGRSSNGVLPFMNLHRRGCGLLVAIGWSGQWSALFARDRERLHMTAGMERTRLRLHPGERIRTPRILLIDWEGDDPERGNNLLRRLLLAHYLPRVNGRVPMPPSAFCLQAHYYLTGEAGEAFERAAQTNAAAAGVEVHWLDACWYGGGENWSAAVGSWNVNRDRFPNGLKPISDAARRAGMKFLLWFEPERVRPNTALDHTHPEFLLRAGAEDTNLLLNLGLPAARAFITDMLSHAITEHGLDIYRQDFNMNPLPHWRAADAPDRVGMTEIRYIEGLYELWDELRRRHPGLWIDNCSSGGRRIDLETCSRALPLWPSDFTDVGGLTWGPDLHVGDQCIRAGLARWMPLMGGGLWNFTPYSTRAALLGGFTTGMAFQPGNLPADDTRALISVKDALARGVALFDEHFPVADLRAAIEEWRSVRPFVTGDFHLLAPLTASAADWCAWQLHRADLGAGVAVFFRRRRCPFPTMEAALRQIDPDADYEVGLSPGHTEAPRRRMRGQSLLRLPITIPEAPGSLLLRYSRVDSARPRRCSGSRRAT